MGALARERVGVVAGFVYGCVRGHGAASGLAVHGSRFGVRQGGRPVSVRAAALLARRREGEIVVSGPGAVERFSGGRALGQLVLRGDP
ncbi:hypothetical protein BG418_32170 [Streptomyces sp. CBMA152]|nr:hypothetical protein [Streptomyces sp. CBMA152]